MKQNVEQLLTTVQCDSPKHTSKKTGFTQYGTIRIQKKMTILENLQNSREFRPGILGTVDSNGRPKMKSLFFHVKVARLSLNK